MTIDLRSGRLIDGSVHRRRPGAVSYGYPLGIVALDFDSPFVPGDMGNASTFDHPVLYRQVPGLTVAQIFEDREARFADAVVDAASELVAAGAQAITSKCGFMVRYQERVADAVGVPAIMSSLGQLPFLSTVLSSSASIAVITANSAVLDEAFLREMYPGIRQRLHAVGMQDEPHFKHTMIDGAETIDRDGIAAEVCGAARAIVAEDPHVGAILLECAALPAYAAEIQRAVRGLPVFDFTTAVSHLVGAHHRREFAGYF